MSTEYLRSRFEKFISGPPFELEVDRFGNDPATNSWPGCYRDVRVDLAWRAWKQAFEEIKRLEKINGSV